MTAVLTYNGYALTERQSGGWQSVIDGKALDFDSASQWVQYINYLISQSDGKTS